MPMEAKFYDRYSNGANNRSYFISDALIYMRSYNGAQIDRAAASLSNDDVAAFHRVIAALNATFNAPAPVSAFDVSGMRDHPANKA